MVKFITKSIIRVKWDKMFIKAAHRLFKDCPARFHDSDEKSSTGKTIVKFCKHRWHDKLLAIKRAIEILEYLKSLHLCLKKKKKKFPILRNAYVTSSIIFKQ